MKKLTTMFFAIAVLLTVIFSSTQTFAQLKNHIEKNQYEKFIGNLQSGIKSDNLGLKNSSIYFTGLYQIEENIPLLIKEYQKTDNQKTKDLIVFTLYIINDENAFEKINFSKTDFEKNNFLVDIADGFKLTSEFILKKYDPTSK
ncbi:MAG: hypothetical protein JEY94_11325 [Melioribacteraceae bacterium]|nr:hypothetical protein [Melioribacteraceae bacterium]